jgi:RNA polymerase sigma-70 factor (ECF subfamily)
MQSSPTLNPLQERLLVLRAQEGDSDAFRILCHAYEARLLYFLRRFTTDEHSARDLLQEVWLEVYRKLGRLRATEAFRRWLYQIAHDRAVSSVRRDRRETEVLECLLSEREVEAVDEFETSEQAEAVHVALGRLNEDQRVVLTLRFLEDLSIDEIAEVLRLPAGTVKSRLHYAKESLRRLIAKEHHDG